MILRPNSARAASFSYLRLLIGLASTASHESLPTSHAFSVLCRLFASFSKLKFFIFSKIRTLLAKHRGWGYPRSRRDAFPSQPATFRGVCWASYFHKLAKCFFLNSFPLRAM